METRKHARSPVVLKARYLNKGHLQSDLVTDLSPGGLFLETPDILELDTEVDLEITLDDEERPTHVRGRIVRVIPPPHPRPGMGVQFTGLMGPLLSSLVSAKSSAP